MAKWRTKACELFAFPANRYSFAHGKVDLFADQLDLANNSGDNFETLERIAAYVTWASNQTSDQLSSAVDLAFFLPMFRDRDVYALLKQHFSPELLAAKQKLLLDDSSTAML